MRAVVTAIVQVWKMLEHFFYRAFCVHIKALFFALYRCRQGPSESMTRCRTIAPAEIGKVSMRCGGVHHRITLGESSGYSRPEPLVDSMMTEEIKETRQMGPPMPYEEKGIPN